VDRFRQELFAVRDELFDFAASGRISFEHPAYGMLRSTMNGFLRWAESLHLLQVALWHFAERRSGSAPDPGFEVRWTQALSDLDPETQDAVQALRNRMHEHLVRYLVFGSPALMLTVIFPVLTWLVGVTLIGRVVTWGAGVLGRLETQAHGIGAEGGRGAALPTATVATPA